MQSSIQFVSLLAAACLGSSAIAQVNLRPDMRTWTVTPSHSSIQVTKSADKITWTKCQCGNVPVTSRVSWLVPQTGLYLMSTPAINLDASGTDRWTIGIRSPRAGDGFSRIWTESTNTRPNFADFPQGLARLTKGDAVELFVDGRGSTFGGRELRVVLWRVEAPAMQGTRWWESTSSTRFEAQITPRFANNSQWIFFASSGRFSQEVPIPGLAGSGLWLSAPFLVMTQQRSSVQVDLPVSLRWWPTLSWQILEVHNSTQGLILSLGGPNELFSS